MVAVAAVERWQRPMLAVAVTEARMVAEVEADRRTEAVAVAEAER